MDDQSQLPISLPLGQKRSNQDYSDVTLASQENSPSSQDFDLQRIAAHEEFATIVATAAIKKKEFQIQPVLTAIEINNSRSRADFIRGKTNIFKKDVIIKGILFLESLYPPKSQTTESSLKEMRIDEIKDKLAKFMTEISPNYCNNCNSIFKKQNGSKVTCFYCSSNLCQQCSSEDSFNKAKIVMKNIVAICSACQEESEEACQEESEEATEEAVDEVSALLPLSQPPITQVFDQIEVLADVHSDKEVTKQVSNTEDTKVPDPEEFQVKVMKKKMNGKKDTSDKVETEKEICHFYVQFRCKYGRSGKDCEFEHPKICLSLMNKGTKGCSNAENCEYVHPKMCQKSLNGKNCENKRCFLGHVLGTRDLKIATSTEGDTKKDNKDKNFRPTKPKGHVPQTQGSSVKEKRTKQPLNPQEIPILPQIPLPTPPAPQNNALEVITLSLKTLTEQLALMQKTNQEELINLWKAVSTNQQSQQTYAGALNQNILPQTLSAIQSPQQFYLQSVRN